MDNKNKLKEIFVSPDENIKNVISKIDVSGLKIAIIIENEKVVGILTDSDIRKALLKGFDSSEPVKEIMQKDFFYVERIEDIDEKKLDEKKIEMVPILDKEKKFIDLAIYSFDKKSFLKFSKEKFLNKSVRKVLVIGGAGYIGSILVKNLLNKGYIVKVLDKFIYGEESLQKLKKKKYLEVIKGDARHIEEVVNAVEDVDAVVHLAEIVGDPAAAINPKTTQENNYLATKMIAEVCKYFQINRMVYASSCSVYGASKINEYLDENSTLNPVSLYAKMKIASENAIKKMTDKNFLPTILRFSTVFGQSSRPRFDLVINLLTAKALKEKEITIFNGDQWRPFVHVEDLSKTIIKVLESPLSKVGGEIFNVGDEKNNYTINQIAEMIKREIPESKITIKEESADKRNYRVSFLKLKKTLGIELKKDILYGIKEIKSFLKSNGRINYKDDKYSNVKFLLENEKIFC
jgi:nucleoside-diphosphate-sugar epimerase